MTTPKHGVVLARVTSKVKGSFNDPNKWIYTLNTGHKIRLDKDVMKFKQWYMIEMKVDDLTLKQTAVSFEPVDHDAAERLGVTLADMSLAVEKAVAEWKQLESTDRTIVMQTLGMGAAAVAGGAAMFGGACGLLEAVAAESLLGVCTGGASIAVGAAFAGLSYLQYEQRKETLSRQIKAVKKYRSCRNVLARRLARIVPPKYEHLMLLDPEFSGICTQLRMMIDNFDFKQLFDLNDDQYAYSVA